MFKVICTTLIDFSGGYAQRSGLVNVGDIFTVIGECIGYGKFDHQVDCYKFEEFSHTLYVFDKRNFSPLSDIDEQELVNTKEEQYV